ncbi:hypothetical protein WH51_00840 [Bacilli bacterium VT-13-104]|nr:hypothetical protein WH51_00840 [Bacilli bacterium VT-13-104]
MLTYRTEVKEVSLVAGRWSRTWPFLNNYPHAANFIISLNDKKTVFQRRQFFLCIYLIPIMPSILCFDPAFSRWVPYFIFIMVPCIVTASMQYKNVKLPFKMLFGQNTLNEQTYQD